MLATFKVDKTRQTVDVSKPIDISIPLEASEHNPLAWYLDLPKIEPVKMDDWTGKVSEGASVNFNNIYFNPHAHGTHTECVGHITSKFISINEQLKEFFFTAELITVLPETIGEDQLISKLKIESALGDNRPEALIIRTLPNDTTKKSRKYSNTNWPYLHHEAATFIREIGVKHLLIDLPSVDKEKDDGKLLAHRAFWNYPKAPRMDATITEFIYVPNSVKDDSYMLNLQIASFNNDATPSKPILYKFISSL
ncbi:cyclase family protein [Ulvibacter antarcticus]|uniref:Kynurenine formamidase n=1 Tax=Ulvibacter antarcticus TaxID=442714 RepID=A0A3L9Z7Y3_9FLAO|nr:cyclase family protein [Ulvibacter antarcticus]RMA66405.1 kynurenine formamidase [Ulvibacter antarcticus]